MWGFIEISIVSEITSHPPTPAFPVITLRILLVAFLFTFKPTISTTDSPAM
jgi:hypothetical protein